MCKKSFVDEGQTERMRHTIDVIVRAIREFFDGASPEKISAGLEADGITYSALGIRKMIKKFIKKIKAFAKTLTLNKLGDRIGADEVLVKMCGKQALCIHNTWHQDAPLPGL